ncbi:hypothetical protein OH807_21890 [Kitasatospora sp. NBC_01560]|uniref:hypothetical protein n=1 Tax=Kitasatospora sp. NBC_01560 TaxID=2975965 RepID=UPI0038650C16
MAQKKVQRVLTSMSTAAIQFAWQTDSPGFVLIYENFCAYVNATRFGFDYCDVLADFSKRVVQGTTDSEILRLTIGMLPKLGQSHNRWHVQDVLAEILQPIREAETAVVALEALQDADPGDASWAIHDFIQRSLHPLLKEGVKAINSTGRRALLAS